MPTTATGKSAKMIPSPPSFLGPTALINDTMARFGYLSEGKAGKVRRKHDGDDLYPPPPLPISLITDTMAGKVRPLCQKDSQADEVGRTDE